VRARADGSRGKERQQDAEHEAARALVVGQRHRDVDELRRIDAQNCEDGAELDQHLKGLAGIADAEEVLGQQKVTRRGDGQELRHAFDEPEQDDLPDRH
jgi:hypothetical protein